VVHLFMGISDMKKFLIKIVIFFAIVALVDFSLGSFFHYLQAHAGGRTGAEYYVCEKATEDVIIMGSSRASHHYVPEIISEKLGMSCFNAGQDGNGIILQYGRWNMLSKRYTPKLIIYDITAVFDFVSNDNRRYVDHLKPFSNERVAYDYISSLYPSEKIKLLSGMYCYNYKFIEMFFDFISKGDYTTNHGYIPLYGQIRKEIIDNKHTGKISKFEKDPQKLYYFEQFLKETRDVGTKVVLVVSPSWSGGAFEMEAISDLKNIAIKYKCSFYEYLDTEICENPLYFKDSEHLNDDGAKIFTESFISDVTI